MKIPEPNHSISNLIDAYHESKKDTPRHHIGPSSAGEKCDRALWLKFRWAIKENFSGRIKRLFRRGQNEEAIVVSDLLNIGIDVRETGRSQRNVHLIGHVSGSIDGIISMGVPGAPNKPHILEIKTHNKDSFNKLEKEGPPEKHLLQMQCYMKGANIDRALYVAVCKDDDRIFTDRIEYKPEIATKAIDRLHRITLTENIPAPISKDPTWFECKMCACHDFCHVSKKIAPSQVNCRTCAHSTPKEDGTWHCAMYDAEIPKHAQIDGCRGHVVHPDLTTWKLNQDKSTKWTASYDGKMNGIDGYESAVLLAGASLVADIFGAVVVKND